MEEVGWKTYQILMLVDLIMDVVIMWTAIIIMLGKGIMLFKRYCLFSTGVFDNWRI